MGAAGSRMVMVDSYDVGVMTVCRSSTTICDSNGVMSYGYGERRRVMTARVSNGVMVGMVYECRSAG